MNSFPEPNVGNPTDPHTSKEETSAGICCLWIPEVSKLAKPLYTSVNVVALGHASEKLTH